MKTPTQRWMDGDDHHPESERLVRAMADMDFKHNKDSMCIKVGGDGDNGELMMYLLDMVFEADAGSKARNDSSVPFTKVGPPTCDYCGTKEAVFQPNVHTWRCGPCIDEYGKRGFGKVNQDDKQLDRAVGRQQGISDKVLVGDTGKPQDE